MRTTVATFRFALAACAALALASVSRAETVRTAKPVANGFELVEFVDDSKPLHAFMLKADLSIKGLRLNVMNGADRLCCLHPVSKMVPLVEKKTGTKVMAAINGDFCQYSANPLANLPFVGRTCRMSVSGGVLMQTGYETAPGGYDSLYADAAGVIRLGRVGFRGEASLGGKVYRVNHVNTMPLYLAAESAKQPAEVGVFTALWPQSMPGDGVLVKLSGPMKGEKGAAVERTFKVVGKIAKGSRLPADDACAAAIVGFGAAAQAVAAATGDGKLGWSFPGAEGADVREAVGVWNRPLKDGVACNTHETDNYPRTAFGLDSKRGKLCLFVADGRRARWSKSLTSREMAELFLKEGCDQAGQFDGGGSTVMWLAGRGIVNRPSDLTGERSLGSGIFLSLTATDSWRLEAARNAGAAAELRNLPTKAKFTQTTVKLAKAGSSKAPYREFKGYVTANLTATEERFRRPVLYLAAICDVGGVWRHYDTLLADQNTAGGLCLDRNQTPAKVSKWQPEVSREAWTKLKFGAKERGYMADYRIPEKAKLLVYRLELWMDGERLAEFESPAGAAKKLKLPENWWEKGANGGRITYRWPPPPESKKK